VPPPAAAARSIREPVIRTDATLRKCAIRVRIVVATLQRHQQLHVESEWLADMTLVDERLHMHACRHPAKLRVYDAHALRALLRLEHVACLACIEREGQGVIDMLAACE